MRGRLSRAARLSGRRLDVGVARLPADLRLLMEKCEGPDRMRPPLYLVTHLLLRVHLRTRALYCLSSPAPCSLELQMRRNGYAGVVIKRGLSRVADGITTSGSISGGPVLWPAQGNTGFSFAAWLQINCWGSVAGVDLVSMQQKKRRCLLRLFEFHTSTAVVASAIFTAKGHLQLSLKVQYADGAAGGGTGIRQGDRPFTFENSPSSPPLLACRKA